MHGSHSRVDDDAGGGCRGRLGSDLWRSQQACDGRNQPRRFPLQPKLKLLHSLRAKLRLGHFSPRTEEAYVHWVHRFVRQQGLRHPREMGEREVVAFLTHLAVERQLAAATQAQALAALQFLYRHVIDRPLVGLGAVPKAAAPVRLPVVLSEGDVQRILQELDGVTHLIDRQSDQGRFSRVGGKVLNDSQKRPSRCFSRERRF